MSEEDTTKDFADLYADLSGCLLALTNALEDAGVLGKGQMAKAAIHLACQADGVATPPFHLLRLMAIDLDPTQ